MLHLLHDLNFFHIKICIIEIPIVTIAKSNGEINLKQVKMFDIYHNSIPLKIFSNSISSPVTEKWLNFSLLIPES